MNPKYIIVEEAGLPCPIVFNPVLSHKKMAAGRKVLGAGFCQHVGGRWKVHGESNSLGREATSMDERNLNIFLPLTAK
jgi:hypothetical protein